MDFGLHLQQDMPCSAEQFTHAPAPEVSSEAGIGKALFPFSGCRVSGNFGEIKRSREKEAVIYSSFSLHVHRTHPLTKRLRSQ